MASALLAIFLVFLLTAAFWQQTGCDVAAAARSQKLPRSTRSGCTTAGLAIVLSTAWHPPIWQAVLAGYKGDSFYTLSVSGATGLFLLSALLFAALLACNHFKTRWLQTVTARIPVPAAIMLDSLLTLGFFWIAITLVPQLYYAYYRLIFHNLPTQWVIKHLAATDLWSIGSFLGSPSLAAHFSALVLWALLVAQWLLWLRWVIQRGHSINRWQAAATLTAMASTWHALVILIKAVG